MGTVETGKGPVEGGKVSVEVKKPKSQLRVPVLSDLNDAMKNTADVRGALQTLFGGAEVAALLIVLTTQDAELARVLIPAILGTSLGGLWAIDRGHLVKRIQELKK